MVERFHHWGLVRKAAHPAREHVVEHSHSLPIGQSNEKGQDKGFIVPFRGILTMTHSFRFLKAKLLPVSTMDEDQASTS